MLNSILAQDVPIYCGGTTSSSINSCAPMFDIPDVLGIPTIRAISANSSGPWAKGHAVPRVPQVHMMLSNVDHAQTVRLRGSSTATSPSLGSGH